MPNLNRVILMGNLTRDPELRYTPSGTAICAFGLAVNREFQTKDGEKQKETCFVEIETWGRRGEVITEYLHKGNPILVEGRLKLDQWEDKEGVKHTKLKVVAESFEFVGGKADRDGAAPQTDRPQRPAPSQQPQGRPQPPAQAHQASDPKADDIPF